jgi:hypothetical protein
MKLEEEQVDNIYLNAFVNKKHWVTYEQSTTRNAKKYLTVLINIIIQLNTDDDHEVRWMGRAGYD